MDNNTNTKIAECKALIESQVRFGPSEHWKQRDFEQLIDLIFEKTGTSLSLSTLKRIWSGQLSNAPQNATLNALAQFAGFKSWNEFRSSGMTPKNPLEVEPFILAQATPKKRSYKKLWSGLVVLLLLCIAILSFLKVQQGHKREQMTSVELKPEVNFRHRILSDGLPNTVVFSFDLSKVKADSFFFQQTWDYKTRILIPAESKNFSSIYYYPGYHTAKLFAGKVQIAEEKVHIKTNGWKGIAVSDRNQKTPVYIINPIHDNMLYTFPDDQNLKKFRDDGSDFSVRYYNINDFEGISGENFSLTAKVKNAIEEGALTCQDVKFYIFCESGMFIIPFSMPGCVGNLNLMAGNNFMAGRNNDLSALGINLSDWQTIVIKSSQNMIRIKTSVGELSAPYGEPAGGIKGLMIEFHGTGVVDEMTFGNMSEIKEYYWKFN